MRNLLAAPLGIAFMLGGPITYILNIVDTWQGHGSVVVKLLISLTLDAILALIWPITWTFWIIMHLAGSETPLSSVLGL